MSCWSVYFYRGCTMYYSNRFHIIEGSSETQIQQLKIRDSVFQHGSVEIDGQVKSNNCTCMIHTVIDHITRKS